MIGNAVLSAHADPVLVISGRGSLPLLIARAVGDRAHLIALQGFADADTCAHAQQVLDLGAFGAMIEYGHRIRAKTILFIGGLERPSADQIKLDRYALENLDMSALSQGDDAVLRAVAQLFEDAGFLTVGALDLCPELAMPNGLVGEITPTKVQISDGRHGFSVAKALGQVDVGQSVVVQQGLVLAVEGIEGTDALIRRSTKLARSGSRPVLVKVTKPQQDMRLDLPTFGPETLQVLQEAEFAGAFVEAHTSLLVDQEKVTALANTAGIFLNGLLAQ